jgi:hypothetical protein
MKKTTKEEQDGKAVIVEAINRRLQLSLHELYQLYFNPKRFKIFLNLVEKDKTIKANMAYKLAEQMENWNGENDK